MDKRKTLYLKDLRNDVYKPEEYDFEITKMVNTVHYEIGQRLSRVRVNQMIESGQWHIIVQGK